MARANGGLIFLTYAFLPFFSLAYQLRDFTDKPEDIARLESSEEPIWRHHANRQ